LEKGQKRVKCRRKRLTAQETGKGWGGGEPRKDHFPEKKPRRKEDRGRKRRDGARNVIKGGENPTRGRWVDTNHGEKNGKKNQKRRD